MPTPQPREKMKDFVSRYMASKEAQQSFPTQKQRVAVAYAVWRKRGKR